MDPAFERDLGYLTRFFEKLEAHARTLTPDAGARLGALVGEERERWREITRLVGATSSAADAPSRSEQAPTRADSSGPNPSASSPASSSATLASPRAPARGALTVGSLFGVEPPAPTPR
jgi:hypothetical protein